MRFSLRLPPYHFHTHTTTMGVGSSNEGSAWDGVNPTMTIDDRLRALEGVSPGDREGGVTSKWSPAYSDKAAVSSYCSALGSGWSSGEVVKVTTTAGADYHVGICVKK